MKNKFDVFVKQFKEDTGLEYKEDLGLYIQYFHLRLTEAQLQVIVDSVHIIEENTKPTIKKA